MKEVILGIVGAVGSAIASFFGGWDAGLTTLLIFMAVDYLSGLIVAGVFHKSNKTDTGSLESKTCWKGLCRKCKSCSTNKCSITSVCSDVVNMLVKEFLCSLCSNS